MEIILLIFAVFRFGQRDVTDYYWLNGVLSGQKTGNEHILFLYDENGSVYGMLLKNGTTEEYYYYIFNA